LTSVGAGSELYTLTLTGDGEVSLPYSLNANLDSHEAFQTFTGIGKVIVDTTLRLTSSGQANGICGANLEFRSGSGLNFFGNPVARFTSNVEFEANGTFDFRNNHSSFVVARFGAAGNETYKVTGTNVTFTNSTFNGISRSYIAFDANAEFTGTITLESGTGLGFLEAVDWSSNAIILKSGSDLKLGPPINGWGVRADVHSLTGEIGSLISSSANNDNRAILAINANNTSADPNTIDTYYFRGNISGPANARVHIEKNGTARQEFLGASNEVNNLVVNAGELVIGNENSTNTFFGNTALGWVRSASIVVNGGMLEINGTTTTTASGINVASGGTLILNTETRMNANSEDVRFTVNGTLGGYGSVDVIGTQANSYHILMNAGSTLKGSLTFKRELRFNNTATGTAGLKTVQFGLGDVVTMASGANLQWAGNSTGNIVKIDLLGTWEAGGYTLLFDLTDGSEAGHTGDLANSEIWLNGQKLDGIITDMLQYRTDLEEGVRGIYLLGYHAIPEPSTWLMLGAGVAFLVIFRRRKASK